MASCPLWKLRRLAPRVKRVLERRKGDSPALAAHEATLGPAVTAFIKDYDAASIYEPVWRRESAERASALVTLRQAIQAWVPLVQRDVVGFDGQDLVSSRVPDDVIEGGNRLYDIVTDYRDAAGQPLAYQAACLSALDQALKAATKEIAEAEVADVTYQGLQAAVRASAATFDQGLIAFRRTLGAVVGRSDRDYQKLRAERAQVADAEDDATAPPASTPIPSAPAGTTTPASSSTPT